MQSSSLPHASSRAKGRATQELNVDLAMNLRSTISWRALAVVGPNDGGGGLLPPAKVNRYLMLDLSPQAVDGSSANHHDRSNGSRCKRCNDSTGNINNKSSKEAG